MSYCKPFTRGVSWRSQNFGDSATIYGPHSGNDDAAPIGTPVHAAGDGVIEWAGEFDDTYHDNLLWLLKMGGNIAVLNCGDDEPSFVYGHMHSFAVKRGDRVRKGQVIGYSGNTGTATTGAHLHTEAIPPGYVLNSPMLGRVNPDIYLTEWPEDINTGSLSYAGETTTPVQEDDMANLSDEQRDFIIKALESLVENAATKADLKTETGKVPGEVWAYKNPNIGGGDAYQILRDAVAGTDRLAGDVAKVAAQEASNGATVEQITAAVKQAISESVVKVDVTVGEGK